MRIVFLGTPDFAVPTLKKLIDSKHEIIAVVTQPDRPVGRKQILTPSPVKSVAIDNGLKVLQFGKIRNEGVDILKELKPDIMVTCAFGQILSQEILNIPKYGVINVHASLLPKYRGAAPIQWAVINGETETGVTIMKTDVGIDTGDIIYVEKTPIYQEETAGELFDRLSEIGAGALIKVLKMIDSGDVNYIKQDDKEATYVKTIKKEDGKIDWSKDAKDIVNLVRGMNPWPIAYTSYNGKTFKIHSATVSDKYSNGKSGEVLCADTKNGLIIGAGNSAIFINEIQAENGKKMPAKTYLLGNTINVGELFD